MKRRCSKCQAVLVESEGPCQVCGASQTSVATFATEHTADATMEGATIPDSSPSPGFRLGSEDDTQTAPSPYSPSPGTGGGPHLITPSAIAATGPIAGRYRIVRFIGRGGMGEVFEAQDLELGEPVALKFLLPQYGEDERAVERFKREILLARKVAHPNVCRVFDVGNHVVKNADGTEHRLIFLSMELLKGETLARYIKRVGRLGTEDALVIVRGIVAGLEAAHGMGIVHRDLKSSNVILVPSSTGPRAVVTDFGLARTLEGAEIDGLSASGEVLGTPAYMAPEQVRGEAVTTATDIYCLGVMLFEMVAGARPFSGPSPIAVALKRLTTPPPSPRELVPDLDQRWESAILRCLQTDPGQRFGTAGEFVRAVYDDSVPSASGFGDVQQSRFGLLTSRSGLLVLLALVMAVNWIETSFETSLSQRFGLGSGLATQLAASFHRIEGFLSFDNHDVTNWVSVYGYSICYFFVFPLMVLGCGVALARRRNIGPFRVFCLAIAFAYLVSLPFFIAFPIPERWAYPDSGAILLSDLWTSSLIESARPISGLDNCFPSFHCSLSVVVVIVGFLYRLRLRYSVAALAMTIILSTFVLGIHWLADIAAGIVVAVLTVALAIRADRALSARSV